MMLFNLLQAYLDLIREHFANRSEPDHPDAQTYAFTYTFLPTTAI